jgi:hypothetical protein
MFALHTVEKQGIGPKTILNKEKRISLSAPLQACQIFLDTIYQKRGKIYQIAATIKYTK